MLKINNLEVNVSDKSILKDFNLEINDGEIHALMGPNGVGKSTICKTILGDDNYKIINGDIIYNNQKLNDMKTTDRARLGIFLLNQNPIAIEGVTNAEMLRIALSEKYDKPIDIFKFNNKLINICNKLNIPNSFIHRNINEGMSGGERKKNELLHMWMLEPSFIMLDEVDSGLDVDALKVVASSINEYYQAYKPSILIITHHKELLELIHPEFVHVLKDGKVVQTGDINLALDIEKNGFMGQSK
jgi:Fe-S cluster assembly ATP-binding protein